jgi:thiamine-monophosphate kinase
VGEFELIRQFFMQHQPHPNVVLGNGDDAALLQAAPGHVLAVSTDMLVQGRHFFADVDPYALGHKALAVNLSDMAAMGAKPVAFTLALALDAAQRQPAWLQAFAAGLLDLAQTHGCALVGGDTTAGPFNVCITIMGEVPAAQALKRSAAQVGDDLYVTGDLGRARVALEALRSGWGLHPQHEVLASCRERLERPTPRIQTGLALRGLAHACADVSDGLLADLGHILHASGVSAQLDVDALFHSPACHPQVRALPRHQALTALLAGGDDYELVLTAPAAARAALEALQTQWDVPLTRIGRVLPAQGHGPRCELVNAQGQPFALPAGVELQGFDHFA